MVNDNTAAARKAKPQRTTAPATCDVTKPSKTLVSPTAVVFCSRRTPSASATTRRSAAIAAPPAVAQPQAHEMALALRLGVIDELRSCVPGGAIVDVLDLAGREVEVDPELG